MSIVFANVATALVACVLFSLLVNLIGASPLPMVVWHGMGDTCCNPLSIGALVADIKSRYNVPVVSVNTGSTDSQILDFASGFFGDANTEIERVCNELKDHPDLKGAEGINMVGFSQGGQFARAVVQRCRQKGVPVKNLMTWGGQHQGIVNVPGCTIFDDTDKFNFVCARTANFIGWGANLPLVQAVSIQAQYVKAPGAEQKYLKHNHFLPNINNEVPHDLQQQYKDNLMALDKLILVRFKADSTVVPRDSAWFSWYNGTHVVPLREQALYTEDRLGLAAMDLQGQLFFEEVPGGHMDFTLDEFYSLVDYYFK